MDILDLFTDYDNECSICLSVIDTDRFENSDDQEWKLNCAHD